MIEVAKGDACTRPQPVVKHCVHIATCASIGMALEIPPDPIVVVSGPVGKQFRAGVQQQSGRFRGRGGDDDHVGRLDIQIPGGVEVFHALGMAMIVDDDLAHYRFGPQLAAPPAAVPPQVSPCSACHLWHPAGRRTRRN